MQNEIVKASHEVEKVTDDLLIMHLENLGLVKNLTDGEKNTYLQICKAYNLNPFKREVHVSKYKDQMSIITGYETYIKRAERSGVLSGWDVTTEGSVQAGDLKAIITIERTDRAKPFKWEVDYSEYVQEVDMYENNKVVGRRPNKFWQKAKTMIKKVAMAQGFRLCFNDELGGMPYTGEEITENAEFEVMTETVSKPDPTTPAMTDDDKKYRQVVKENDVEIVVELIETAGSSALLKVFSAVNGKFFKAHPDVKDKLIEKGKELKAKETTTDNETKTEENAGAAN